MPKGIDKSLLIKQLVVCTMQVWRNVEDTLMIMVVMKLTFPIVTQMRSETKVREGPMDEEGAREIWNCEKGALLV